MNVDNSLHKKGDKMKFVRRWFDSSAGNDVGQKITPENAKQVDWLRVIPFILIHVACLGFVFTGTSTFAVLVAIFLYVIRMFAITGFYHRYFSHRTFKTSRTVQFIFAVIGASSSQRGPIWWSAHHRHHHRKTDIEHEDPHTPKEGFWWSHMGWFLARENFVADTSTVPDLMKYPELRWLDRFDIFVPFILALSLFVLGSLLEVYAPSLETNGWQLLVWGYFISTIVLIHVTLCINSLAHTLGKKRYDILDDSRNNFFLAILTLGEGWHNNHHYYPGSTRQGFYWWEIDITYYFLKIMSWFGLVWDLKPIPKKIRDAKHLKNKEPKV